MSAPGTLLIVGASGGTGRQLVIRALALGFHVRAWSRTLSELSLSHPNLEHVEGDVRDRATAYHAVKGCRAVLSALGSQRGLSTTTICAQGTASLVAGMHRAGVRRLIAVTSLGITKKMGPVLEHLFDPLFFSGIYDDKRNQETVIRESGLEWVIVRPGRLTDSSDARRSRAILDGALPGVHVSRSALARFMLEQVSGDQFLGRAPYLVEPAPLQWHKLLTLGFDARPV